MKTKTFTRIAMIAAVYTIVSMVLAPISFGVIQVRIAEALTVLPLLYQPAVWGVTLGCFLTNLLGAITGLNPTGMLDALIGTTATLLAAICTYHFRNVKIGKIPVLSLCMPVVFNFVFVGAELGALYMPENFVLGTLVFGAQVAVGELISVVAGWGICNWPLIRNLFEVNKGE